MVSEDYKSVKLTLENFGMNNDKVDWDSQEWSKNVEVIYPGRIWKLNVSYLEKELRDDLKKDLEKQNLKVSIKGKCILISGEL